MGTPKYDKENTTRINLKLNNKTDADIIQQLKAQESIQGYIKRLIREGMRPEPGEWIEDQNKIVCSHCQKQFSDEILYLADMNFCPACGAAMKKAAQK